MHRDFNLKLKALSDTGAFTGLASPYGDPPDLLDDVIEPGAYRQAIAHQGKGYPFLFSHQQDQPLGVARISDSQDALLVDGELVMEDPNVQRAHAHMKKGSMRGLSIGFLPVEGKVGYRSDGVRVLKEIRLLEISLVAIPAAPRAQITAVKSLGDIRYMLKSLHDGDVDDDSLSDLLAIDHELKRLLIGRDPAVAKAQLLAELGSFAAELRKLNAA
jgi:HK97 family phage prohead protease